MVHLIDCCVLWHSLAPTIWSVCVRVYVCLCCWQFMDSSVLLPSKYTETPHGLICT